MQPCSETIIAARSNIKKIYFFSFFWMFLVIIPIIVPYFLNLGLTMEQIFKLQAIFGLTVAVLEVPSGYLCDLWGRKNTLIVGATLTAIGFTWLCSIQSYTELVLYEMLIAVGLSLVSGTDVAILYDSLHVLGNEREANTKAMGNVHFAQLSSESVAAILGGALATVSFQLPLIVHAVVSWVPLFISLTLFEPKPLKKEKQDHFENIKKILFDVFKKDPLLRLIFINLVVWGLSTFIAVWIFQKYWEEEQIALSLFGLLWALYNITAGLVGKWAHWIEKKWGSQLLLIAICLAAVLGYIGMGLSGGVLGVAFGLLFQISRGLNQVILRDALNSRIENRFRATINSLSSLFFRLGFALVGPLIGFSIDSKGVNDTLLWIGAVFAILAFALMVPLLIRVREFQHKNGSA